MIRQILLILFFAGGVISVLLSLYHFASMFAGAEPERKKFLPFVGPVALLSSSFWGNEGNQSRVKFFLYVILFAVCATGVALVKEFLPK